MTGRSAERLLILPVLAFVIALAAPARAQSEQVLTEAREQFNQAIALQAAGDCAGALEKLQRVARIKLTPHVQFNIALCEERLGRLMAALGHYRLALADAEAASISEVTEPARAAIEGLERKTPRLTLVRGDGAEQASITLDTIVLDDASIGSELRRDPGPHRVVASIDGRTVFEESFRLAEGEQRKVVVVARAAPAETKAPPVSTPAPASTQTPAILDTAPKRGGSRRTLGYVAAGAGVAGVLSTVVFVVLRKNAIDELESTCNGLDCPTSADSTIDRGRLYTGLAEGSAVLGVAGLTLGAVLLFGGGSESASRAPRRVALAPAAGGAIGLRFAAGF